MRFDMRKDSPEEWMTTSAAARHCGVTRFTIRNWIVEKKLKAAQTAGHHRRVLKSDLLRFMEETGMCPVQRAKNPLPPVFCWEFNHLTKARGHECAECLVFKERANRCFLTIRAFGADKVRCGEDCSECAYMATYFPGEKAMCATPRYHTRVREGKSSGQTLTKGLYGLQVVDASVPEPATMSLLALAGIAALIRRRRRA